MVDIFNRVHIAVTTRLKREDGQAMVEYALILALVAVAVIVALTAVGGQVNSVFNEIKSKLDAAVP